jgi:hypothetical protein
MKCNLKAIIYLNDNQLILNAKKESNGNNLYVSRSDVDVDTLRTLIE